MITGEAGVGKSALLDDAAAQADGCRVIRVAGVQSEMELAYAGLHQLCTPLLDRTRTLPEPQRDALGVAFGITSGAAPDRFLVGLAVLGLLGHDAPSVPLICVIDDEQWLDRTSAQVLAFVARRLGNESLGLIFATRALDQDLAGLPVLPLGRLGEPDARALLESALPGPIDAVVRDQIVAETGGLPLAILELPKGLAAGELAGGFALPRLGPVSDSIEENFRRRAQALPARTRRLLLVAAADPTADVALVRRATATLGTVEDAMAPAVEAGLIDLDARLRFRHPLVRSSIYRSASAAERREAHRVLAEATDPDLDPDRRAWHRAEAVVGLDDEVAAELEGSADRAQARGGLAAAAAFLERAAALSADADERSARALEAARIHARAGTYQASRELLATAEAGALSAAQRARADLVRAQIAFSTHRGSEATTILLRAARNLEQLDPTASRASYLEALATAIFAGRLAGPGADARDVARRAALAPPPQHPTAPDLLLDGLSALYTAGHHAGLPLLHRALAGFGAGPGAETDLRWLWLACVAAMRVWDDDRWEALSARYLELARRTGAMATLPLALTSRAQMLLFAGDLATAERLNDEADTVSAATGSTIAPYGALGLAALQGDEARTRSLVEATKDDVTRRGEGAGITFAEWSDAVLFNGLGRYRDARAAAERAMAYRGDDGSLIWAMIELVEAAARTGDVDRAREVLDTLAGMTGASGSEWALGLEARCRGLVSSDESAERAYRHAVEHLDRTHMRLDQARARLLYGEWLRRQRRRTDAREHLRVAHEMFDSMGAVGFAHRARRELRATGDPAPRRAPATQPRGLTPQEAEIARLARDGLTNPEIGLRLFLSPHTVQYHLRKVYAKLDITSRSQLERALA